MTIFKLVGQFWTSKNHSQAQCLEPDRLLAAQGLQVHSTILSLFKILGHRKSMTALTSRFTQSTCKSTSSYQSSYNMNFWREMFLHSLVLSIYSTVRIFAKHSKYFVTVVSAGNGAFKLGVGVGKSSEFSEFVVWKYFAICIF